MDRIVYDQMKGSDVFHFTLNVHLYEYVYAHQHLLGKSVLDAACGTCFGTMIYSTAAKSIMAVDNDSGAIEYGKRLQFFCPIIFSVKDLNKDILPEVDVCVSMETIEHLNGNGFFLRNLKAKKLVFSIPLDMPGKPHRIAFKKQDEVIKYLAKYKWKSEFNFVQEANLVRMLDDGPYKIICRTVLGVAERN